MAGRRRQAGLQTVHRAVLRVASAVVLCVVASAASLSGCGPAPAPSAPPIDAPSTGRDAPYTAEIFGLAVTRTYRCANGSTLSVRITQDPHRAEVSVDGGIPALLDGVVSGAGARFERSGMSFHTKGAEALWGDFLKEEIRCVEQET